MAKLHLGRCLAPVCSGSILNLQAAHCSKWQGWFKKSATIPICRLKRKKTSIAFCKFPSLVSSVRLKLWMLISEIWVHHQFSNNPHSRLHLFWKRTQKALLIPMKNVSKVLLKRRKWISRQVKNQMFKSNRKPLRKRPLIAKQTLLKISLQCLLEPKLEATVH